MTNRDNPSQQSAANSSERGAPERVVVKFGTNLLTGGKDALDEDVVAGLVAQVAEVSARGVEVVVVTSGAVAAGREALARTPRKELLNPKTVAYRQTLAALGQAQIMRLYERLFGAHGLVVAQALLSRADLEPRAGLESRGYMNARSTLLSLLQVGAVPVVNENDVVATDELEGQTYGDNDRLSAMVASVVGADLLVLLGDMEGLFTADPHIDPEALVIPVVDEITSDIERAAGGPSDRRGRGGMASKLAAARLATASGTTVVIASGRTRRAIVRIYDGEPIGTRFTAKQGKKADSRKRRILSAVMDLKAGVTVNDGAAKALTADGASLLAVGIVAVDGEFDRGDRIGIRGPDGKLLFTGVTNYSAADVAAIKGRPSKDIAKVLGHDHGPEVVHRNNMAPV